MSFWGPFSFEPPHGLLSSVHQSKGMAGRLRPQSWECVVEHLHMVELERSAERGPVPASFMQTNTKQSDFGSKNLNRVNTPTRLACEQSCRTFSWLLMDEGELSSHRDDTTPGLPVLGALRKRPEQARQSKPVSSTPPWPELQFLLPGSCLIPG